MSIKTKDIHDAKRPSKYWSLDEFNRTFRKVSDAISVMLEEPQFFIEVAGEVYYIPKDARIIVKSAATVQCVFE